MLTLLLVSMLILLVSMLILAFNVQSVKSEPKTGTANDHEPADPHKIQEAINAANLGDTDWPSIKDWLIRANKSNLNDRSTVRAMDDFRASLAPPQGWSDFAYFDDDSAEVVIGLSDSQMDGYVELIDLISVSGGQLINSILMDGNIQAVVADVPFEALSSFIREVEVRRLARYVEPNIRFEVDSVPNDPDWPKQWGPHKIKADWAWNTATGDPSVLVAVVDSGIDWNHPDLAANYVALGYDWVNNDSDPMDDYGHGTHCAGVIAAVINNSIGIAGLAKVSVMAEKGLSARGYGYEDWLANAIIHAVDQGANIISMSWGSYFHSELIYEAIQYAYNTGVLLVAAAGNDAWSLKHYPAAYNEVIAVSATDEFDEPAKFTNFGDWIDVAAPGVRIYSTVWNDSYDYMSGTSMSTPHISGVAALIWSQFPDMTRDQVCTQLLRTADDLGDSGLDEFFGHGRVNARNAVEHLLPNDDLLILEWDITRWAKPEDLTSANVTVLNFGKSNQSNITVQLIANGDVVDSASIEFLTHGESATVNLAWSPTREGICNVTVYVVPVLGEDIISNNAVSAHMLVRIEKVIRIPRDFKTIKEAIDIASSDFTIYVASGLYREHIVLYKSLKLVGEEPTTTFIDGNGIGTAIIAFSTSNISVNGFTIQNGIHGLGIYLWCIKGSTINNNLVTNNPTGIYLDHSDDNNVTNNTILNNEEAGLFLSSSDSNDIINNKVLNNEGGICLQECSNNTLRGNIVTNDAFFSILFYWSSNNTIIENKVANNTRGIWLHSSGNNTFYHNNFIDNPIRADLYLSFNNTWDDGYPSGGNYWSDYTGVDLYSGPYQNETGSDGIGDAPYVVDDANKDRYPLIYPYGFVPSPDLNHDEKVDILDAIKAADAFGSYPGHPRWNYHVDQNKDSAINILDLIIIAKNFGKTYS